MMLRGSDVQLDNQGVRITCPSCGATNRLRYLTLGRSARCAKCHAALPQPATPVDVPDASAFDAAIPASSIPVVVDFWAPWCGPCRMMAPQLATAAQHLAGKALVVKVNTEDNPDLAERFGIRSIPTLAIFHDGREVTRAVGAQSASAIEALVSRRTYA
jgi:thioredoxin 2